MISPIERLIIQKENAIRKHYGHATMSVCCPPLADCHKVLVKMRRYTTTEARKRLFSELLVNPDFPIV